MSRNRIVGFGSADGLFNGLGCSSGELDQGGECIPTTKVCPPGAHVVNLSPNSKTLLLDCECGDGLIYANGVCQSRGSGSGSSGGSSYLSSGPSVSKSGVAIGAALIVAGLVGWLVFSVVSPTRD